MGGFAPDQRFVELVINDNYRGLYLLLERISTGNLGIEKVREDSTGRISGGYIVEADENGWQSSYPPESATERLNRW